MRVHISQKNVSEFGPRGTLGFFHSPLFFNSTAISTFLPFFKDTHPSFVKAVSNSRSAAFSVCMLFPLNALLSEH